MTFLSKITFSMYIHVRFPVPSVGWMQGIFHLLSPTNETDTAEKPGVQFPASSVGWLWGVVHSLSPTNETDTRLNRSLLSMGD